jgi:hypothetical protein
MSRLAELTFDQWFGLIGLIVFGSVLMYSIAIRKNPPGDRPK